MKIIPCVTAVFAALAAVGANAQSKTDYTLNEGQVMFHVPGDWTAIMEKTDGNPQAIAFNVPDPGAQASDDAANVTVKTRQVRDAAQYGAAVQDEFERAKGQSGYEIDGTNTDTSAHRYYVLRGKTKYFIRDSFMHAGTVAVEVRCERPVLAATPPAWSAQFDAGCDSVVASLKR